MFTLTLNNLHVNETVIRTFIQPVQTYNAINTGLRCINLALIFEFSNFITKHNYTSGGRHCTFMSTVIMWQWEWRVSLKCKVLHVYDVGLYTVTHFALNLLPHKYRFEGQYLHSMWLYTWLQVHFRDKYYSFKGAICKKVNFWVSFPTSQPVKWWKSFLQIAPLTPL